MLRIHQRYLVRLNWIDHQLQTKQCLSTREIVEHFEITEKTAKRDIEYLREQLLRPVEYSAKHRAWCYTSPVHPLLPITLTEGEIALLLLTEQVARAYGGSGLGSKIEAVLAKVASTLTDAVTVELSQLATLQTIEALPTSYFDLELFSKLIQAVQHRRRAEMVYFTQSRGKTTTRRIDPLHLYNAKGEWYVLAFDHWRKKVLDFHLGRIRSLTVTGESFEPPVDFNLETYLNSGFGMFRGEGKEEFEVVVEFDSYQAGWIRQQSKVHSTAVYKDLPDGGLHITMHVGALQGVKMWVLQYGAHARVLAPEKLKQELLEESQQIAKMYSF